jgi:hypothetical protein
MPGSHSSSITFCGASTIILPIFQSTKMGLSEKMGEYSKYLNIMMNQWILRLSNP